MDPRVQVLIRRLQVGPYDTTAFGRIHDELTTLREEIAVAGDHETLIDIIGLIDKWAQSTRDRAASSMAQFESASLCEIELKDTESAVERYALSLELNPGNAESFNRLVPLMRNHGAFERLETILIQQESALANINTVEPSFRVEVLREIANVGAQNNRNLNSAIQALEEIVNLEPDLSDVKELARLRSVRGQPGDIERAADLFNTVGDVLGAPDGIEMVSKALDLNPSHEEALGLLEQWTPQQEHFTRLKYRWAAYLEKNPSGPAADARRCALAQAYGESKEFQKGLDCIAPLFDRGDAAAKEIHIKLRAGLEIANRVSQPPQPSPFSRPSAASRAQVSRPMKKKTMVGYRVDPPTGEGRSPFAAPQQRFTPPNPLGHRTSQQPPSQTADFGPPKPPVIAAAPVPASALIRPDAQRVEAIVQENSGSYQQVDIVSQPPGAPSEPAIPISLPPGQLLDSPDRTVEYELRLQKKSRLPWFVAAGIVLLSATGFAAYQFTSSESEQNATQQETTGANQEASPQSAESVTPPTPEQAEKPALSPEAKQSAAEEKTPTETAEPSGKSSTKPQEAQAEEPPKRKTKTRAQKKSKPVVELLTKRARFKRGKVNRKSVFDSIEKNMPKIERCYARALKRKKNLKGRVTFAWTIKKNGFVYGAKRIQGPIKDKKMINCVRGVLNKIRYQRPKKKSARVIMPFLFKRPR